MYTMLYRKLLEIFYFLQILAVFLYDIKDQSFDCFWGCLVVAVFLIKSIWSTFWKTHGIGNVDIFSDFYVTFIGSLALLYKVNLKLNKEITNNFISLGSFFSCLSGHTR